MRRDPLRLLRCPETGEALELRDAVEKDRDVTSGVLVNASGTRRYEIVASIPRFVAASNYAENFGFQWNEFRRTQLDSHSGTSITRDRFALATGLTPGSLAGKRVLDVGCGAGRFAEIALAFGAEVVALDYSSAVDACWLNLGSNPRLSVVQGDIYRLPFAPESFDVVYCLGVLQHTPDVERALKALPAQLRPGGTLVVDVYAKQWRNVFLSKYWVRPLTKRIEARRLFRLVQRVVPALLPVSDALGRAPVVGRKLRYLVPVSNYAGVFPLTPTQRREWAVLDTFDMLSPKYDQPQSAATLTRWLKESGLQQVEVFKGGHLVGRGRKPR